MSRQLGFQGKVVALLCLRRELDLEERVGGIELAKNSLGFGAGTDELEDGGGLGLWSGLNRSEDVESMGRGVLEVVELALEIVLGVVLVNALNPLLAARLTRGSLAVALQVGELVSSLYEPR